MITMISDDGRRRLDLVPREEGVVVMVSLGSGARLTAISDRPLHILLEGFEEIMRPLFETWPPKKELPR